MIQRDILISGMRAFVERFRGVTFRFEFDERRACFLISYDIPSHLLDEDDIWDALFSFKSRIRDEFGDEAPIFMEGECICRLSSNAQIIQLSSSPSDNSFVSENTLSYIFSISEDEVCFFDGYEGYLKAA